MLRQNDVRDLIANLFVKVCKDVKTEPQLLPLTDETFHNKTTNVSNKA